MRLPFSPPTTTTTTTIYKPYTPPPPPPPYCNYYDYCHYKTLPFLTLCLPSLPTPHPTSLPHVKMDSSPTACLIASPRRQRKVVVVMGSTGSGKSRLSIDLATRFFPQAEIINSDKIQLYRGLDITTNIIPMSERRGVPHHLLGHYDPTCYVSPSDFRRVAASIVSDITSRRHLPFLVGGSNSLVYSLLSKRFDPDSDVFNGAFPISSELRYNCCFLWVDVSSAVLNQYLSKRVDEMIESGMFEELAEFYGSREFDSVNPDGLGKSIGVPEFEKYFKTFGTGCRTNEVDSRSTNPKEDVMYEEAVRAIKDNTCQLAKNQVSKILRLKEAGWDIRRIDATEAFRAAIGGHGVSEIWEKQVVEPSVKIVKRFLEE